jgi:ribonuclease HI
VPDLLPEQHLANAKAIKENDDILFDPALPKLTSIEDGFRAFSNTTRCEEPAHQANLQRDHEINENLTIAIGGTHKVSNDGDIVAIGTLWYGQDDARNRTFKTPDNLASPEAGEWAAILEAAKTTPKHRKLELLINTPRLIKEMTTNLPRLEKSGWIQTPNSQLIKAVIAELRERCATTSIKTWGKHLNKQDEANIKSLIRQNENEIRTYNIPLSINPHFETSGIVMSQGSQRLFYKGIREVNSQHRKRRQTRIALAITHHATREISLGTPTEAQIWRSIRDKDLPKGIRGFLWKNLHGAYRLGEFWQNIPNFEQRGTCNLCGEVESMEHILIECENSPARKTIWKLAEELWKKREKDWPDVRYGTILGSNLAHFTDSKGKRLEGKSRLFTILITESAHMIWKLRCERVIKFDNAEEKFHSEKEIHNRWIATINKRLKFDKLLTNTSKYGKSALRENLVLRTWSGVLKDEDNLPDNWIRKEGVLVGIVNRLPPGRSR